MGIQDRDYYREGPSFLDRVGEQGATVWLIAITCGVFFGQMLTGVARSPLVQLGAYDPARILEGEVWRLFTPIFLHAGIGHLIFNMLALFFAGRMVEQVRGAREFVCFYLAAGVFANLVYLALQVTGLIPLTRAYGASGAVVAVLVLYACHFPRQKVLLFFVLPMPAWGMVVLFVAVDMFGAFGVNPWGANIAFVVHLGGALFGLLYFQSGWRFTRLFARGPAMRVRPRLRVIAPPDDTPQPVGASVEAARPEKPADEQFEARVDAVLEKVSKYGKESLTADEREILVKASELYKKRRK